MESPEEENSEILNILANAYFEVGDIPNAVTEIDHALALSPDKGSLQQNKKNFMQFQAVLNTAIEEVRAGKHSTDNINYFKSNISQLISQECFETAINQLKLMAEARQAKTTNILWIGSSLKDIYFNDKAIMFKDKYDRTLLEEMIFYYLKSCKLFDPGYQQVQGALKKLKE
ncbi:hypothetical protein [Flexithrix dorotheae]|uniref:hypothetical protein n=1 Tax=Flexithrix dorotheae TaxID=70993 RepID=UPI00146E9250|nr:hypothetical protein [Flexithrix dorotheae]